MAPHGIVEKRPRRDPDISSERGRDVSFDLFETWSKSQTSQRFQAGRLSWPLLVEIPKTLLDCFKKGVGGCYPSVCV